LNYTRRQFSMKIYYYTSSFGEIKPETEKKAKKQVRVSAKTVFTHTARLGLHAPLFCILLRRIRAHEYA